MLVGRSQRESLADLLLELLDGGVCGEVGEEQRAVHTDGWRYHLEVHGELLNGGGRRRIPRARAR